MVRHSWYRLKVLEEDWAAANGDFKMSDDTQSAVVDASNALRWLEQSDNALRSQLGGRYEDVLNKGKMAIVIHMVAYDVSSPFVAAIRLAISGDVNMLVGNESEALAVLLQSAFRIKRETASVSGRWELQ